MRKSGLVGWILTGFVICTMMFLVIRNEQIEKSHGPPYIPPPPIHQCQDSVCIPGFISNCPSHCDDDQTPELSGGGMVCRCRKEVVK